MLLFFLNPACSEFIILFYSAYVVSLLLIIDSRILERQLMRWCGSCFDRFEVFRVC